ncbi:MAG: choice-of-anchor B family protein [Saprospiraceae bacterium]
MQRLLLSCFVSLFLFAGLTAQQAFNTTLRSNVTYDADLNDIWAYVAPDGTEYALVGLRSGVSIVSLADPDNATEVVFLEGQFSTWRDLKVYGEYAYVVADQGSSTEGLTIIDLTDIANGNAPLTHNNYQVAGGTLQRAHNIYIDVPTGLAYLAGANINSGGMVIFDVATTPGEALFVAAAPAIYSHDVYVQDGIMYASEIYKGFMTLYDVSDPQDITELGGIETPFSFTHNIWVSADGQYAYTTDERGDAPMGAYDVSDPANIIELDEFRPLATVNEGVIPHNTHFLNDYLVLSYYTDGLVVVDASRPSNLIEVAHYDTWLGASGGFNGAWGATPFLPSGLVLVSDISSGLFVIEVDYQRAAFLEGTITASEGGNPLAGATVEILESPQVTTQSTDGLGRYQTGQAAAGTYSVRISRSGYQSLETDVELVNGQVTILDTFLLALPTFTLGGSVVEAADLEEGVAAARVILIYEDGTEFTAIAGSDGTLALNNLFVGTYDIYYGAWGYRNAAQFNVSLGAGNDLVLPLENGYLDDFIVDQGWSATSDADATSGFWVRDVPVGTNFGSEISNPGADVSNDIGNQAYITGNGGGAAGSDDIDGGAVILTSPIIDLEGIEEPILRYQYWFYNAGGNADPNDFLRVELTNGSETVTLAEYTTSASTWREDSFLLNEIAIDLSGELRIRFTAVDQPEGHLSEAGLDNFEIYDGATVATEDVRLPDLRVSIAPNPSAEAFRVSYDLPVTAGRVEALAYDVTGRLLERRQLSNQAGAANFQIGGNWLPGTYFLRLVADGKPVYATKLVRM